MTDIITDFGVALVMFLLFLVAIHLEARISRRKAEKRLMRQSDQWWGKR